MADIMSSLARHNCMSHIRGRNTRPEMLVRSFLHSRGLRFRIHVGKLPGTPDIVLRKYHAVVLVNGCFWHGHEGCSLFRIPKTNTEYWTDKIGKNRQRDERNLSLLRSMGWHVIRIWECQLRPERRQQTLDGLLYTLNGLFLFNSAHNN